MTGVDEFSFPAFVLACRRATVRKREDRLRGNEGFLLSSSSQVVGGDPSERIFSKMDARLQLSGMTVRSIPVTMEIKWNKAGQ